MALGRLVFLLSAAGLVLAAPVVERATPSVTIANGTIKGGTLGKVEFFNEIPFAQPPVGNLRLRPPQPITSSFGTIDGTTLLPKACPQFYLQTKFDGLGLASALGMLLNTPLLQAVTNAGEDCLNLNVARPAGTSPSAKLPVVVWIFGGGFEVGSSQIYKPESLIERSISLGAPILFVAINYRVGGFGFLAGKELAADGSTNLGLRDQRLALQWVQDNIAAFGGDPTKVTLWGESAGAISIYDHSVINGGDNTYKGKPLFRGAIMNSGSVAPADPVTAPQAQAVYDQVVAAVGCSGAAKTLDCLRAADYTKLLNAMNSVPHVLGPKSLALSYVPRPDPSDNFFPESPELAVNTGKFAKVPLIIGDQEDEGTLFSLFQNNITTNAELIDYLVSSFPNTPNAKSLIKDLVATYPDNLGISGSPYGTLLLYNIYPQFKRLAAILGDVSFTLSRRVFLAKVASSQPCWSYLSSYLYGTPVMGTFHASDILYSFGLLGDNIPTRTIQTNVISFVNKLDPNALGTSSPLISWPQWTPQKPQLLNMKLLSNSLITDDFRKESYDVLRNMKNTLRI